MLEAASSMSAEGIVKMWLGVIPQASEQYLKTVGSLMRSATKRATGRDTE